MKKRLFVLALMSLLVSSVFAYNRNCNEENIKMVKTQWFDIIYPEKSETSAKILYTKADQVYEEVSALYGTVPSLRMPVVIVTDLQLQNAFFTDTCYSRIVLLDTSMIEDLEVFSENLLSTFRHELTHAVTMNYSSGFIKFIKRFLPPTIPFYLLSPNEIIVTPGLAESATVTSESSFGEGRLNDEFAMHPVKQALLEGKFPNYTSTQGIRTKNPTGVYYMFNGMFAQWLQKEYGQEKYAQWWYRCESVKNLSVYGAFKKVYKMPVGKAWKMFRDQIDVSNIEKNPVEKNLCVQSFNSARDTFDGITSNGEGFAFINSNSNGIYYVSKENYVDGKIKKAERLLDFTAGGSYSKIKLSKDNKYLVVTKFGFDFNVNSVIEVYDMKKKTSFILPEKGLFDGIIVNYNCEDYLVAKKYEASAYSIEIYKLGSSNGGFTMESVASIPFDINDSADSLTDSFKDDGTFAFILKTGLNFSICEADLSGKIISKSEIPENRVTLRYLTSDVNGSKYAFTYTVPGSMPRFGYLDRNSSSFVLNESDISGGYFNPAFVNDSNNEENLIFIRKFYENDGIFTLNQGEMSSKVVAAAKKGESSPDVASINEKDFSKLNALLKDAENKKFTSSDYNPFALNFGILLPISLSSAYSYTNEETVSNYNPLGVTYFTVDPWSEYVHAGVFSINPFAASAALEYMLSYNSLPYQMAGTGLSYSLDLYSEFDISGWKKEDFSHSVNVGLPLGHNSSFSFNESGKVNFGRADYDSSDEQRRLSMWLIKAFYPNSSACLFTCAKNPDDTNFLYVKESAGLYYSNKRSYSGKYETAGVNFGVVGNYELLGALNNSFKLYENYFDLGFTSTIKIPRLLPVNDTLNCTFSLPTQVCLNLFNDPSYMLHLLGFSSVKGNDIPSFDEASVLVKTVLFDMDIQGAIPCVIFDEVTLHLIYEGGFDYKKADKLESFKILNMSKYTGEIIRQDKKYNQYVALNLSLTVRPAIGSLSSAVQAELACEAGYVIKPASQYPVFILGINSSL